jgi:hypothetical protein
MRILAAAFLAFALACTVSADTQQAARPPATPPPGGIPPVLDTVEVVGCLESAPKDTWMLARATAPEIQRRPTSSPEAVKAAATKALGNQRFRLMNIAVFNPAQHAGHKMVVRGILIKDPKDPRINTMSFQMVDAACAK